MSVREKDSKRMAGQKGSSFFSSDKKSNFSEFGSNNYRMSQNPDRTVMSFAEIGSSFKPSNLLGINRNEIGGRFGTFDDPGTPLGNQIAADRAEARKTFDAPMLADARTIGEIRRDQELSRQESAEARDEAFRNTGVQTFGGKVRPRLSADDTFGTNMMSNPAFGFRSKMTAENQAKYDRSAAVATERAKVDPSLGNVITSTANLLKRQVNKIIGAEGGTPFTREKSLTTIGERQEADATNYMNRTPLQRRRSADIAEGISMQDRIRRNQEQMRMDAAARNERFQAEKRQKAVEKAAARYGSNVGSGRDGGFGTGTVGKGMPSNPAGMRQQGVGQTASNLSRHQTGPSSTTSSGSKSGGTGRGGARGGSSGGSGSSSKGGTGSGGTKSTRTSSSVKASKKSKSVTGRSKTRCDIRCKYDIAPLINMNLEIDDLANFAYFVKTIRKK